jgi:hypothetical protein
LPKIKKINEKNTLVATAWRVSMAALSASGGVGGGVKEI